MAILVLITIIITIVTIRAVLIQRDTHRMLDSSKSSSPILSILSSSSNDSKTAMTVPNFEDRYDSYYYYLA